MKILKSVEDANVLQFCSQVGRRRWLGSHYKLILLLLFAFNKKMDLNFLGWQYKTGVDRKLFE